MATEIGIDLGTYKTVIFSSSKIVLELPSAVTVDAETFLPVYYGEKARQTLGRTPDTLECILPIQHGLISDYDVAQAMLTEYMNIAFGSKVLRPRVMATLPTGLTELQHRSVSNAIETSGGRNISVLETPLAVAFGLGLDISNAKGRMVIDMGAGTTDVAVLTLGSIAESESVKIASGDFDRIIQKHIRQKYNIEIGLLTAEDIKKRIGSVIERRAEVTAIAKGRNLFTGLPQSFEVTSSEIYGAIKDTAVSICEEIRKLLERVNPDLIADITSEGVYLTGGGSQIFGMDKLISSYLGISVITSEDPSHTAVKGAAEALKNPQLTKNINYRLRSIKELEIN